MTSGEYFNKGVKALDSPHIGHVVRDTDDLIVVFGGGDDRYDIPKSEIRFTSGNVLIDLSMHDIAKRYKVSREEPLPVSVRTHTHEEHDEHHMGHAEYPKSLFNKGVRTNNEDHVGHVVKETNDKIVVFGHYDYRFDIPKSEIVAAGRNVIVGIDFPELLKYRVERNAQLPTGEPIDKLAEAT
jgi:hypothetical protein